MLAQLKKTPVAAGLAFLVACAVCFLPAIIAAIAAGGVLSLAGGFPDNAWLTLAGVLAIAAAAGMGGWMIARRQASAASSGSSSDE